MKPGDWIGYDALTTDAKARKKGRQSTKRVREAHRGAENWRRCAGTGEAGGK